MRLKGVCTSFGAILGICIGCLSLGVTAAQQAPEDLAQLWIEAIKENSTARIRPLIHPACPQNSIAPEILVRMVGGGLPETYDIETRELGPRQSWKRSMQSCRKSNSV